MWTTFFVLKTRASGACGCRRNSTTGSCRYHSAYVDGTACIATLRKPFPSRRNKLPNFASQMRVAFASIASNTTSRSLGDPLMMPRTWEVAFSRSRDSLSSRRHASSSPWLLRPQVPSRLIRPCLIRHPRLGQLEVGARCDLARSGHSAPGGYSTPTIARRSALEPERLRQDCVHRGQCHFGMMASPIRGGHYQIASDDAPTTHAGPARL